jgi:hypothetical protein
MQMSAETVVDPDQEAEISATLVLVARLSKRRSPLKIK